MDKSKLQSRVNTIRKFNRFYTKLIGLLNKNLLKTPYSLTQARILFEIFQKDYCIISEITRKLDIDPGYLSRILTDFEKNGLIQKNQSSSDSRQRLLKLKAKGKKEFEVLNDRASKEVELLLEKISEEDQLKIINAMYTIQNVFEPGTGLSSPFLLRYHKMGDIGWMIYRHGILYANEYSFNENFEILVTEILLQFAKKHDPKQERIWIAEKGGDRVGSVMVSNSGNNVAQLRLLLVEPKARGKGLGKRLIDECIDFSRRNGYGKIKLFTVNILQQASHLYSKAGFRIVNEKPYTNFGPKLTAQIWELTL